MKCSLNYVSPSLDLVNYSCPVACVPDAFDKFLYDCTCSGCQMNPNGFFFVVAVVLVGFGLGEMIKRIKGGKKIK